MSDPSVSFIKWADEALKPPTLQNYASGPKVLKSGLSYFMKSEMSA